MIRFYGLALLCFLTLHAQSQSSEVFLVPVTAKPNQLMRLQFAYQNDSVKVWGVNLGAIPLGLKKAKLVGPKTKFNYPLAEAKAAATIERNYALQKDTTYGFKTKLTGQSYYNVLKSSFLSGKGNAPIFVNQNISLGGFPAPPTWPKGFSANISGVGIFSVRYLPAMNLGGLPVFDAWDCEDAAGRFYKLRALQGYGLDKITYIPYNARKRETVTKSFDIYFESNSTQPKQQEIKAITDYLEQNKFEILTAAMTGGASVEGDEKRNKQLQRDRAQVISKALSRYNKSAVKKDTVLLSDNWPSFRNQIKSSAYAWLDTLSNDKIRENINQDDKLRKGLESILKTQRKASLSLTMAKILTADDQFVTLRKSINNWLRNLLTSKPQTNKDLEPQIMGAVAYLFDQHKENVLSREEVDSLLMGDYPDHKYMYLGLHIVKQFNEGKFGPEDSAVWKEKWTSLELEPWVKQSQQGIFNLANEASKADAAKYIKMQADFQALIYKLIMLNVLPISYLCDNTYPDKNEYLPLTLNQHAFVYEMFHERGMVANCHDRIVFGRGDKLKIDSARHYAQQDSLAGYIPGQADSLYFSVGADLQRTAFSHRTFTKPNFANVAKGEYYFMLKQGFIKGNKNILSYVSGNLSLDAVSLYHLLYLNILNWDPDKNYFYDRDVRLEEMDRLITSLKKGNPICTPQVNSLYMEYHRKALRYLELYFEPGSAKHKEIADASLKFITEYYKKRMPQLKGDLTLKLALYLNHFNWYPGANEGAWFGFDLLKATMKKRKLNPQEEKLWLNYLAIFDPILRNPLPVGYKKEDVLVRMGETY